MMVKANKSKYRSQAVTIDGLRFGSGKEAKRYQDLKLMERAGEIHELKPHPSFELVVNGYLICRYIADSQYFEKGEPIVEDVKGRRAGAAWEKFRIKAKLMKALYDIDIRIT